jgi:hypothetical protein
VEKGGGGKMSEELNDKKYGAQTTEIEALIERVKTVTPEQAEALSNVSRSEESSDAAWDALWNAGREDAWNEAWDSMREAIWDALWDAMRATVWSAALHTVREALWDEVWEEATEMAWVVTAHDALVALLARDLITPDQFDRLYGPWQSVMDGRQLHVSSHRSDDSKPLLAEIERLNGEMKKLQRQLDKARAETASVKAWLGMTDDQLLLRAEKAETELAKNQATLSLRTNINASAMERLMTQNMRMAYQIRDLEADLAKFHECDESGGCYKDDDSVHVVNNDSFTYVLSGEKIRTVYHKDGE